MEQSLAYTFALLERAPRTYDALLRGLPDAWTRSNEGGTSWTAFDIVGHLVHCEHADWMPRIRLILEHGDSRPFEPLDREAQKLNGSGKTLDNLLSEFSQLRALNLDRLRGLDLHAEDFARQGLHPALGPVTLSNLLATWAAHDMTHLHQLSRVLAHQYRQAVGPWSKFLGVLQCDGHSAQA